MAFPLLLIFKWARRIITLFPLPEWTDLEKTRSWVIQALGLADEIADETATQIDDNIVDALRKVVEDTETWTAFYTLIIDLIGVVETEGTILTANYRDSMTKIADKAGIDFGVFQQLIDMILEFIAWWKGRN